MKNFFIEIAAILSCVPIFAAQKPLTLAEKIAMARQMADEAAQGKAEVGRIVENNFDFNAEVKKFRAAQKTSLPLPDPEDETPYIEQQPTVELHAAPRKATPATEEEIDEYVRGLKGGKLRSQHTFPKQKISPDKQYRKNDSNARKPVAVDVSKREVVDTSNFVNGHFVGTLGADKDEINSMREIHERLDKLDKSVKDNILIYSGSMFEAVCNDNDVHHVYAMPLVRACENVFSEYFSVKNQQKLVFNDKILFSIFVAKNGVEKGAITISNDEKGAASVSVKWSKNLKYDEFCAKITETVLTKIATQYAGKKTRAPRWLELAMAQAYECETVLGASAKSAKICADNPPESEEKVFATPHDASDTAVARAQSYWTLATVAKVLHQQQKISEFLKEVFDGKSPAELSAKLFLLAAPFKHTSISMPKDAKLIWWRCAITGEIWARLGGVFSPARSESEMLRLAVLQVDADEGTKRVGLSGRQIFRNREAVAEEIALRVVEIKVALPKINPLYYNALVSLGKTFEAARDDDTDTFEKSFSDFISELKLARAQATAAKNMINTK